MIVDTHTHIWQSPDQLGPQLSARLRQRFAGPTRRADASQQDHAAAMEPADACLVLGLRSRLLGVDIPTSLISGYIATKPSKLIGFAGIDPMDPACLDQIAALPGQRISGVVISPCDQGFHPMHTSALLVYDRCQAMGLPIVVHMGADLARDAVMQYAQPYLLDEVARAFPQLKLLLTQCGHPWVDQTIALVAKHRNVYTELANVVTRPWQLYQVLLQAHQMDVTDRVLFGSDFPYCLPDQAIEAIYSINRFAQGSAMPSVPREKLQAIVERDALTCLGLKRGATPTADANNTEARAQQKPVHETQEGAT
ncbi:MAG: amidohydrolase family protein [Phycisphaera sp.]|nr:amidohydrolase family protein [Phycisphaera sp.]